MNVVSSKRFTFTGVEAVTEISDLGKGFGFARVYSDACDVGLVIVSERTGREEKFAINKTLERDGDTLGWELVPVNHTCLLRKVTVFND